MEVKQIKVKYKKLIDEQRWDIDYHLPPVEIKKYSENILTEMRKCSDVITEKRNPTLKPDDLFQYVDIASIDVITGIISNPQELLGEEAPSRARKVIHEGDIIISTCRPTRGAIAIVPKELDNQICSTGFSVIRAKKGVSNKYLHFILRSAVVKEQFRKFSTGSSYPAILDDDVKKTVIPLPKNIIQTRIANKVCGETEKRNKLINQVNEQWEYNLQICMADIQKLK